MARLKPKRPIPPAPPIDLPGEFARFATMLEGELLNGQFASCAILLTPEKREEWLVALQALETVLPKMQRMIVAAGALLDEPRESVAASSETDDTHLMLNTGD